MNNALHTCNLAFGVLGIDLTLTSIDPPDGQLATDAVVAYDTARRELLEAHPWRFVATIALDEAPPESFTGALAVLTASHIAQGVLGGHDERSAAELRTLVFGANGVGGLAAKAAIADAIDRIPT